MTQRTLHTADHLLTMDDRSAHGAIIHNGGVVLDGEGRIVAVGPAAALAADERHHHEVLLPGFLNCHVHLTDASCSTTVPGGVGFIPWAGALMERRRSYDPATFERDIATTIAAMERCGTVAIGEVSNDDRTVEPIRASGIGALWQHECIGFGRHRALGAMAGALDLRTRHRWIDRFRHAISVHAPYSVSPELSRMIVDEAKRMRAPVSIHLAEDAAERALYRSADGPWVEMLQGLGAWEPTWSGTGFDPIDYYDRHELIGPWMVAVHLTDATVEELRLLRARGARAVLSPRSNLHITGRLPNYPAIAALDLHFGFGTDGRGSNSSVDVVDEARTVAERWPDCCTGRLLRALTVWGAEVLGLPGFGRLRVGAAPGLVALEGASFDTGDGAAVERALLLDGATVRRVL